MSDPLNEPLTPDEQQAAMDLMAAVDVGKLGGGDATFDRGQAGQRDDVDQSALLSSLSAGSHARVAPAAGTPLAEEFSELDFARLASFHGTDRDDGPIESSVRSELAEAGLGADPTADSRRGRGSSGRLSAARDGDDFVRPDGGEDEAVTDTEGAAAGVERRSRTGGDDEPFADGGDGATGGAVIPAIGELTDPLGPIGLGSLGPDPLGPGSLIQRQLERDRSDDEADAFLARVVEDEPQTPTPNFANAPVLTTNAAHGAEDTAIALDIASSLTDPSERLTITISGVPQGATLSAGSDNGDGTWTLTRADLAGLTITPPANSDAAFALQITATSTSEVDSAQTTRTLNGTIEAVADTPVLGVRDAGGDGSDAIALDITAALTDTDGSETLSITIAGVPQGASLSAGSDNGDGTWTLSPDQLSGLALTPPPGADTTFSLTVTATSSDGADTAMTTATLLVTVDHDAIFGTAGDDVIAGGSGNDVVYGGAGDDFLTGGSGHDVLYGGDGDDTVGGGSGNGHDVLYGGDGDDFLTGGSGGDVLYGGDGNDVLYGGDGGDVLYGGDGDDVLSGGAGMQDVAYGENGADMYLFLEATGMNVFHGGAGSWNDVIDVQGADGAAPGDGWSFELTSGSVISQGDGFANFSRDSSGTITLDDGSSLGFTGVESLSW